jgi:tricorn protease
MSSRMRHPRRPWLLTLAGAIAIALPSIASARTGYYQFPDLHERTVVFAAEGDLWTVPDRGGTARRLTTHAGAEYFPRFSPDGKSIAFTGEYGGNRDVYVVPAEGGEPRRLTWHPDFDEVIDWTPDGKRVIFRGKAANQTLSGFEWHLFSVAVAGGEPEELPLGFAGRLAIDPQSGRWAFNRGNVEFRTWKRYRGGTAPTIWVGDPAKKDFKEVSKTPGAAAFPMWSGGKIFFLSDQGGTANLWSMNPDGSAMKRETREDFWDVRWPAVAPDGRVVFSAGADLHIYQPGSQPGAGVAQKLAIDVPSERQLTRVRYPDAEKSLTSFDLSPDGERLLVVTRGEIISVAVKDGVSLPVTRGSAARERAASFSGDGRGIVYVSDATGEEDLRAIDAWGRGQPRIIKPAGKTGWHLPPVLSPDGKWLAYADQTQTLYVMPAAGGAARTVDRATQGEIRELAFSPDGRYLAYSIPLATDYLTLRLFDTATGVVTPLTGATTNDYSPAWDPQGRYLYFLSDRAANPVMDFRDEENVEIRSTRPFALLLQKDGINPFANNRGLPPSPADASRPKPSKAEEPDKATKLPTRPVRIDLDGLAERYVPFPVPLGSYGQLVATAQTVFYSSYPVRGIVELTDGPPDFTLQAFDLEKRKSKPFLEEVTRFRLAGNKLAVQKKDELFVVEAGAPPPEPLGEAQVPMKNVVVELVPQDEWKQIFEETWRMMREFYWDANMGGVNWQEQRDKYRTLLPRLGTRAELNDLLGELIGELATSHTYISGGDQGFELPKVTTGLLGVDVARKGAGFEVTRVYRGDPADGVRSPLAEAGVNLGVGTVILAVNRRPFRPGEPFLAAFENLADKDVVLTVNTRPELAGARDVVVRPLPTERKLRYADWVRHNREYVTRKSGGKVAYLHLPNMAVDGLVAFDTWFYPQIDKQALIVDVRWNGGGFVSQRILERMRRKVIAAFRGRHGALGTYPVRTIDGPFVVLTNEYAGSDGDIFPTAVQLDKLAPVIGKRSWGGVVGIRSDKPLVDGGMPTQPEFAFWDAKQLWGTENRGVIPDIEVQNLPQEIIRAIDAQLDRGLLELGKLMQQRPPIQRDFGQIPDRSRKAFEKREP